MLVAILRGREIGEDDVKILGVIVGGAILTVLGACATAPPPPPDYGALLMAPCPNPADDMPWIVVVTWEDGEVYRQVTRFGPDNELFYAYEDDPTDVDAERWSISGNQLIFDMNDHFADYEGVVDGKGGHGTVQNIKSEHGTWTMVRECEG
jgi:hypothetical protein